MKERIAATVRRLEASLQVIPALDRVDRLVADDAFEDVRRGRPGDSLHHKEAAVEPGVKKVNEVVFDAGESGIIFAELDEILTHGYERACPTRCEIEPAEQFLPRRLDSSEQCPQTCRAAISVIDGPCLPESLLVGSKIARENTEKADFLLNRQRGVEVEHLAAERNARSFASPRQKSAA